MPAMRLTASTKQLVGWHQPLSCQLLAADHAGTEINERQRKVLQRLLEDGDGGLLGSLNAEKYMKITGTSKPSATRDLGGLVHAGLLWTTGQGKAVRYYVNVPGWGHGMER